MNNQAKLTLNPLAKLHQYQHQSTQQQNDSTLQEQRQLTIILSSDITLEHFKIGQGAKVSCPKDCVIKLEDNQNTLVLFNYEVKSGIWAFTATCRKVKYGNGIGIIDAKQNGFSHPFDSNNSRDNNTICLIGQTPYIKGKSKLGPGCNELQQSEEVRVIVDLQSNPHTFCLVINKVLQPFCVMNIQDRVKFILLFGGKDDEWEFISLEELAQGVDLNKIEQRRRYKYE
ncbi:MAG: hypothetical protein EZS28_022372 [Streblomastix strix]|uniref:SPRY domain-containing protein n=1 Tax=Streblomastix strix TaxID=222440 RepID=A0A5J4VHR8_9EUKA|nr:MAG: hypothetical protein EZS28_022372 [Streblomastix strix]